ncbi:MAG: hypothetical protein ACYC2H_00565 [Thermoplasmatota archaeon]
MTVYQISYDLNRPGQDYDAVIKAIKDIGAWAHPLKSMWFVDTQLNAQGLNALMRKYLDGSDRLFISRVTADHAGWLESEVVEWLRGRV